MLPRAILFDLDDTLVSFDATTRIAWQTTCQRFAPETGLTAAGLFQAIREHSHQYWSDPVRHREGRLRLEEKRCELVAETLVKVGKGDEPLARRIAFHYSSLQESLIDFFPGAEATLETLKARGVRMALVTNGNAAMQRRKIDRFRLERFFPYFFVEGELGFGKPDPRVFRAALAALGTAPQETWCVGDNLEWDVAGAQACGISGVWKTDGARDPGAVRPDRVIRELPELTAL
jgi:HAD superfamily hydrolase (TIGR01549 family)